MCIEICVVNIPKTLCCVKRSIRMAFVIFGLTSVSTNGKHLAKRQLPNVLSISVKLWLLYPVENWSTSKWIR